MNAERFSALAEAYGGDLDRWPADEQRAARAHLAASPVEAERVLAEAVLFDHVLDMASDPVVSGVLRETVLKGAPMRRDRPWRSSRAWLSGVALAAACAAGVIFGAHLSAHMTLDPAADALDQASTLFDGAEFLELEDLS